MSRDWEEEDDGAETNEEDCLMGREGWQGRKAKRTSKVMACLVATHWLCVRAQCFRGEGRGGELMVGTVVVKCGDGRGGGSHGHCCGLQSVICSRQRLLACTAVTTGLSPEPSVPKGLTHCQITR